MMHSVASSSSAPATEGEPAGGAVCGAAFGSGDGYGAISGGAASGATEPPAVSDQPALGSALGPPAEVASTGPEPSIAKVSSNVLASNEMPLGKYGEKHDVQLSKCAKDSS